VNGKHAMQIAVWKPCTTLLLACLVVACTGAITSPTPLITPANATYPFPQSVEVEGQKLTDDHVWESSEGRAHLTLQDGSYRVQGPNDPAPSTDTFLFRRIDDGSLIVQGSNGKEWAYGLIIHQDMYYLFTFNRPDQNCTSLSADERGRFDTVQTNDRCTVSSLRDLTGLLLYLRRRFPYPTSAFTAAPPS